MARAFYSVGIIPDETDAVRADISHVAEWADRGKCALHIYAGETEIASIHLTHRQLRDLRNTLALEIASKLPPVRNAHLPAEIAGAPV